MQELSGKQIGDGNKITEISRLYSTKVQCVQLPKHNIINMIEESVVLSVSIIIMCTSIDLIMDKFKIGFSAEKPQDAGIEHGMQIFRVDEAQNG